MRASYAVAAAVRSDSGEGAEKWAKRVYASEENIAENWHVSVRSIIPLAAGLILAAAAPRAFAFASPQGTPQDHAPPVVAAGAPTATKLSTITVSGVRIPFPVALQLYKKALTRPWSNDPADADKLVCHWQAELGTHLQTLQCMTNRAHQRRYQATQDALYLGQSECGNDTVCLSNKVLFGGGMSGRLAGFTTRNSIQRSAMAPLLAKLPPANASYTLRVMAHGKPLIDYVIKDGDLVHVYHYAYKNAKPDKP
ncbi:MAG TPA: hypothetical protein VFX38_00855 [Gammaproteobacteria bacterium]|nr:hypothetical protein [Gammaproteobacteria bacterium]